MQTALPGQANTMMLPIVAKADGSPITSGTVTFYLIKRSTGKWWKAADSTWSDAEISAGAGTHEADGGWTVSIVSGAWAQGQRYRLYAKESGDLHIPVSAEIICGELRLRGAGSVVVNYDYGGGDYSYKTAGGVGIDNATVYAYLKSDYDAGNIAMDYVKDKTETDVNGQWDHPMNLDPGSYTLYYIKQGAYGPDTQEVTVT